MDATLDNTKQGDQNFETYHLLWLDTSQNNPEENIRAQRKLRTSINHLIIFKDDEKCIQYIETVPKGDRIVLIVSGQLAQSIILKIIHIRQITSIYVYCTDKTANEQWMQEYAKVKGVFNHLSELINQIRSDQNQRQKSKIDESLSISVFNPTKTGREQSTSGLNGQFIHSQLLIDCLIQMKTTSKDRKELITFCEEQYQGNKDELTILKEFEEDYLPERALWWYTRQSFLYRLLNKALRIQNIDLLYLFRFFIRHIGKELEKNKCLSPVCVYRAQMMSKEEVQMLKNSMGDLISMNSFLSTSINEQQARSFLSMADPSNDLERVFFQIDADPQLENTKSFSNLRPLSFYPQEEEILFMVGSIFRLMNIQRDDDDGIWIIRMTLCSYNDHHLRSLFEHMKKQLGFGKTNLLNFGSILKDMGKLEQAQRYYLRLLNQLSDDHKDIGTCYFELGRVADDKGDYELSLEWYKKSLEMKLRTLKPDDPNIAHNYNNMALVYEKKGDYTRALESYNKALVIWEREFGKPHPDVAACLNNMGIVYRLQEKYNEALEFFHRSLTIREDCLPNDHPHLGDSHISIGCLYASLNINDLALKHFHRSREIYTTSLPPEHPRIGLTLENIGAAYEDKNEFQQALSYYKEAAAIYHQAFASTHPDVVQIEKYIQRVSTKIN